MYNKAARLGIPSIQGTKFPIRTIGYIGDSITQVSYLETHEKWPTLVSGALGCEVVNQGAGGMVLASFLPHKVGDVTKVTADYNGQCLKNIDNTWWFYKDTEWVKSINPVDLSAVVGTQVSRLESLITSPTVGVIIMSLTGTNDETYRGRCAGSSRTNYFGDRHWYLLAKEFVRRVLDRPAGGLKTLVWVTGISSLTDFQGRDATYYPNRISKYSNIARKLALELQFPLLDCCIRFATEYANGRKDWASRYAYQKPDNISAGAWREYLASKGDAAGTNTYRVYDWSEDYLHKEDKDRGVFWGNQHINQFGSTIVSNEILKFLGEIFH